MALNSISIKKQINTPSPPSKTNPTLTNAAPPSASNPSKTTPIATASNTNCRPNLRRRPNTNAPLPLHRLNPKTQPHSIDNQSSPAAGTYVISPTLLNRKSSIHLSREFKTRYETIGAHVQSPRRPLSHKNARVHPAKPGLDSMHRDNRK